ncbi:DMT family transporter [Salinicola peritrichatus]|uniref:DMT family transporter n=1 Tax=Salinicola peritrichatus TaxID=1267424 RepID=UPI000DA15C3E|nr:DMT family transporter [Salinicola peritrichatus]
MPIRAVFYLAIVVLLFSGNLLVGKLATASLPPLTLALGRMVVVFLAVLVCFGHAAWRQRQVLLQQIKALAAMSITGMALFTALLYSALRSSDPTNVAVLESLTPAATALVMALFFRERLGAIKWLGVLLSVVGAAWVVADGAPLEILCRLQVGDVLVAGAIASWVLYSLAARQWLSRIPFYASLVPMTGIAVLFLAPLALIENAVVETTWQFDGAVIAAILYLGIGPSLIALICYNRALLLVGPSRTATSLNLLPVVTMVLGYLLMGAPVTLNQIVGALMVIFGVSLVTLNIGRRARV